MNVANSHINLRNLKENDLSNKQRSQSKDKCVNLNANDSSIHKDVEGCADQLVKETVLKV